MKVGGCPEGEELAYGDDCPAGLAELDKKGKTSIPYDSCCLPKAKKIEVMKVGGCPEGEELAYGDDCPAGLAELDKKGNFHSVRLVLPPEGEKKRGSERG